MRFVICCYVLLSGLMLTGCGQMGALQLPGDPDYDKRAKYLLYPDAVSQKKDQQTDSAQQASEQPAAEMQTTTAP